MAKRLTDTDVWKKQRWFKKLNPIYKLAFLYIKDQCDHAGIWNDSVLDLMDDLGVEEFDMEDFVNKCNIDYDKSTGAPRGRERLVALSNGSLWVTGFCQFQYESKDKKIHPGNASISAIHKLNSLDIVEKAIKNKFIALSSPLEPFLGGKDKDKDKDKDKVQLGGAGGGDSKTEKNKTDGKHSRNFKTQGDEIFAKRVAEHETKIAPNRK